MKKEDPVLFRVIHNPKWRHRVKTTGVWNTGKSRKAGRESKAKTEETRTEMQCNNNMQDFTKGEQPHRVNEVNEKHLKVIAAWVQDVSVFLSKSLAELLWDQNPA